MSRYFTLPLWGTPYTRYFTVEDGEVTAIDISKPEGEEVPYIAGVRHNIRPIIYGRHRKLAEYVPTRNAERVGGVTPARKQRVDARDQHDY